MNLTGQIGASRLCCRMSLASAGRGTSFSRGPACWTRVGTGRPVLGRAPPSARTRRERRGRGADQGARLVLLAMPLVSMAVGLTVAVVLALVVLALPGSAAPAMPALPALPGPVPAALTVAYRPPRRPSYQRPYAGKRYPTPQQQPVLHSQNYKYQPREPVVQQHYQQHAAPQQHNQSQRSAQDKGGGIQQGLRPQQMRDSLCGEVP